MNWQTIERSVGLSAVAATVALAVVYVWFPNVETEVREAELGARPAGPRVAALLDQIKPISTTSGALNDGRVWSCGYWDDTNSKTASLINATVVVQWCTPTRG